jgi:hypothetical protein
MLPHLLPTAKYYSEVLRLYFKSQLLGSDHVRTCIGGVCRNLALLNPTSEHDSRHLTFMNAIVYNNLPASKIQACETHGLSTHS